MMIAKALFQRPDTASLLSIRYHCISHSIVSATPSFLFAAAVGWNTVWQILGMLVGVLLFIFLAYFIHRRALVRSITRKTYAGRALHTAKVIRVVMCLIVSPLFFMIWYSGELWSPLDVGPSQLKGSYETVLSVAMLLIIPDLLAGTVANAATLAIGLPEPASAVLGATYAGSALVNETAISQFAQATLATLIEGTILAFALALCAIFLWIVIRVFTSMLRIIKQTPEAKS